MLQFTFYFKGKTLNREINSCFYEGLKVQWEKWRNKRKRKLKVYKKRKKEFFYMLSKKFR